MPILDDLQKTLAKFPSRSPDPKELTRLQSFFAAMKEAGIAKTRRYDLPRPDTIGRSLAENRRKTSG